MSQNFEELKALFKRASDGRRIVLAVGSGLNGKAAPLWKDLLDELLKAAVNSANINVPVEAVQQIYDNYGQATIIKQMLGDLQYLAFVRSKLYEKYSADELREYCKEQSTNKQTNDGEKKDIKEEKYRLLCAVAELCLAKEVCAVIDYNYDNMLEQAIVHVGKGARMPVSVYKAQQQSCVTNIDSVIPIYHVHGYLPDPECTFIRDTFDIVLSQDEYFNIFSDSNGWQTATQLHLLRHHTCVFIGTSLNDWNMLRMLQLANIPGTEASNFLITVCSKKKLDAVKKKLDESQRAVLDRIRSTVLTSVGVKPIFADVVFSNNNKAKLYKKDRYLAITDIVTELNKELKGSLCNGKD